MLIVAFSGFYGLLYAIRRLTAARGFSWIDPPHWRTAWRHVIYTHTSNVDTMRKAYIRLVVGDPQAQLSEAELAKRLDQAARIKPFLKRSDSFTFSVIGDPGEGDDSQLYHEHAERIKLTRDACHSDFVIISSDVVYPAGELMDYERAVYRPYSEPQTSTPFIYAIPGNHDWYDKLFGFFVNFTYPAAHEQSEQGQQWAGRLRSGPWAPFPWGALRWWQVRKLRDSYGLDKLGGETGHPETQQRLSFFEMPFEEARFTIIALDMGCVHSIDSLQCGWFERCLARAEERGHRKLVLLSAPLYVNGAFDCQGMHKQIYELLRRYKVDVVMGGDMHAYQHYKAEYTIEGQTRTMYHIVNGGGGAYLSAPMDLKWDEPYVEGAVELTCSSVYWDPNNGPDKVTLYDLFPGAMLLQHKFGTRGQRRWRKESSHPLSNVILPWLEPRLLKTGWTNVLEHDWPPLLQSYMEVKVRRDASGTYLELTPTRRTAIDPEQEEELSAKWTPVTITISPS
jgi:hypothetical protein